jgi:aminoglycoside 6'-N-acetyltransferase
VAVLRGEGVSLRPLEDADLDPLAEIIMAPGTHEWWGETGGPEQLREDLQDGTAFAIDVDGELAGWIAIHEENEPSYRFASLDIMLAGAHQDQGLGPDALRTAIRWLIERGHHRFTIDPAAHNERAIRAYEAVGFRRVGLLRQYERGLDGSWHDGLLMELLADELRR